MCLHPMKLHSIMRGGDLLQFFKLTASITAVANGIACGLDTSQLNLLSAIFTQLGDTLATISAQRECMENGDDTE